MPSLSAAEEGEWRDDRHMLIRESRTRLLSMLAEAGVTTGAVTAADVPAIVEVMRRFAAIPADDAAPVAEDGDAVLTQFGTYDFRGAREFSADLTRQFIQADDEDAPLWQLSCTLYWDPNSATDALRSGKLWSFGMTLDEFFTQAIALPGLAFALGRSQAPHDLVVMLEEV